MKPLHPTIDQEIGPSHQEIGRWPLALIQLHQRLAPSFARPEPRQHALLYLQAIGSSMPRKNGWQIAEHAKQARPYGMQRLLSRAVWDEAGVRDELRAHVLQCLNAPSLLQIDEQSRDVPQTLLDAFSYAGLIYIDELVTSVLDKRGGCRLPNG